MANLNVTVVVKKEQLTALKNELDNLQKKANEIKINIQGVDTLQKLTTALNKYSQSQVDATNALTHAKQAEIDLLNARTKLVNATTNLSRKKQEEINIDKKATLEKEKQVSAVIKLASAQERTKQSSNRLAAEQEKTARALQKTESAASKLGNTWSRMFQQFTLSNIISSAATRAIMAMRQYFREALTEMKELDTALTHYRQVTGASASEAATLGEEAYTVGSKYGTKASDYAESVATYARAGYGNVADELAELSLKTVIVGQTTQEIADQFLLTMDAAYGYKGSVEELSKVLDGASAIDSSYATTIEKIASGLGLVAPLAKQVHVSEEQLTAAIGTITATTQRSGAESARALRSLFLNIIKDTTTEIEEGVTATEESVKDMETLLNKYAKSAVQAAKASGEVINPMEAIGALAKSMKEGYLTEAELMDMMSSLGGKLRVSQLVALVSNWDMYNDMIQTYEDSMGSADAKTEVYLDSWEAKTNILKNTWTQFIASSLNTDFIKGFITGVTNLVSKLDNLGNALKLIATIVAGIKMAKRIADLRSTSAAMQQMAATSKASAEATKAMAIEAGLAGNTEQNATLATQAYTASQQADIAATQARAAAQKALAMTIGTLVVSALLIAASAYANYHRQRMQELEEERDEAIETAKVHQEKADEIYKAYETYWNAKTLKDRYGEAKISAEEYETAVYNLATALGVQETALANNEEALERLSKREQERAKIKTEDALQEAKLAAEEEIGSLGHKFKSQFLSPEYRQYQMWGTEPLQNWQRYKIPLGQLAETNDVDEAAQLYQRLTKLKQTYLQASKQDTDVADEYGKAYRELSHALASYESILSPIIDLQAELAKYQDQEVNIETGNIDPQTAEEVKDAINAEGDAADAAKEKFGGLADAIAEARESLEKYQKQTQVEKDSVYSSYADAWAKAFEDIQNGMKNSNAVNAAADLFFTPEQQMAMRKKGIKVADELSSDFWKNIFTYMDEKGEQQFINDDAGSNFIWALYEKYAKDNGGAIKDAAGNIVAAFTEDNGELSVTVDDFEALADALSALEDNAMQINPDFLAAIFQALGMYNEDIANTPAEITAIAKSLQAVNEQDEIDLGKLIQGKIDEGATTQEVLNLRDAIVKLNEDSESGIKIHVEKGSNLEETIQAIDDLIANSDKLDANDADVKITAETAEAEKKLWDVFDLEDKIEENSPLIKPTVDDTQFQQDMRNLQNRQYIVKVKAQLQTETVNPTINVEKPYASGTKNAVGGLSLVNEKGAEIIQEGDSARIAGNGKPTLTWIQSGAIVYTASETKAILGRADYGDLYDGIGAYAGGSRTGITRYTPKDAKPKEETGESTPTSSPTTSSPSTKSTTKSDKDEELERLKDIIALREAELKLLQAQNAPVSKQIKKQEEIKQAIQDEIEYLQKKGGSEKEIVELKTKQLKIEDEIKELELGRMKKAVEFRESQLKLLEAQDASVKKQIQKQRQIYKIYGSIIKYLKEHGATQKEINEYLEKQQQIQNNIKKLNQELYDTLKGSINKEVDKLNAKRDKELEKIDKKIEKIQKSNEEEEKAAELQEKQLAVEEAREKLANARQERTIRYYNASKGQWEWKADAQQVESAKKELADAKKALSDYKTQQKLDKRIEALEKQKETVTQEYLKKTDQWQKVLDALEEPVKSVAKSLKAIENNATKDQKSTIQALNKLLKPLGYNIDISKLYDSGGILTGTGGIKGTSKDEVVLPPDIASKMLKPISTATLNSRLNELRYLYGATSVNPSGIMNSSNIGSQYNGNLYTFGNITLTEGQARSTTIYELVQTSRGLRAYSAM